MLEGGLYVSMDAQLGCSDGLPFLTKPHDTLRLGLSHLKEDAAAKHPVEIIQLESKAKADASRMQMQRNVYGIAAPARASIEAQILSRFQRLPGLPSSMLGLEAMTGDLEEFG